MELLEIKKALRKLSQEELEQVKQECQYLLSKQVGSSTDLVLSSFCYSLYDNIRLGARAIGISNQPTIDYLENQGGKSYNAVFSGLVATEDWYRNNFGSTSPADDQKIAKLLARILIRSIKERDDYNTYSVIYSIKDLPLLFEKEFPEYIQNGLHRIILLK